MTQEEVRTLRKHINALKNLQELLADESMKYAADRDTTNLVVDVLKRLDRNFPGLVPPLRLEDLVERVPGAEPYYKARGLRAQLAVALGTLEAEIHPPESNPIIEKREFPFVKDAKLREILERDYEELQRASVASCWKSVIILAGGAIEAILTDLLQQDPDLAKTATKAPKQPDISKWDLADLINVSVERNLVGSGVGKLSHPVREYRNLVHPGNEIRNKLVFGPEEARIALEVLHMVHRDLSK